MVRATLPDVSSGSNLPTQTIGPDDLIAVSVYDAPEFSRTVRVGADGNITLPLMKHSIAAAGLMPLQLEARIAEALRNEDLLKEPSVTVTIAEYQSRPITVSGSVRNPVTFQAIGKVRLMEAITRAGGLAPEAGPEALISSPNGSDPGLVRRIPLKPLLDASDPKLDILLDGGEEVRIPALPPVDRVFVLGNVKSSGAFPIADASDRTVLGALTLAGGLAGPAPKEAYIVRLDDASQKRSQVAIQLKDIIDRKAADVPLIAHDILYVPVLTSKKHTAMVSVQTILALAAGGALVYSVSRY
jgi:polysaccharide export outer membrane protein